MSRRSEMTQRVMHFDVIRAGGGWHVGTVGRVWVAIGGMSGGRSLPCEWAWSVLVGGAWVVPFHSSCSGASSG